MEERGVRENWSTSCAAALPHLSHRCVGGRPGGSRCRKSADRGPPGRPAAHGLYSRRSTGSPGLVRPRPCMLPAQARPAVRRRGRAPASGIGPLGRPLFGNPHATARQLRLGRSCCSSCSRAAASTRRARRLHGKGDDRGLKRYSVRCTCGRTPSSAAHALRDLRRRGAGAHATRRTKTWLTSCAWGTTLTGSRVSSTRRSLRSRAANHIDPAKPIVIGQRLRLPAAAPALNAAATRRPRDARPVSGAPRVDAPLVACACVDGVRLPDEIVSSAERGRAADTRDARVRRDRLAAEDPAKCDGTSSRHPLSQPLPIVGGTDRSPRGLVTRASWPSGARPLQGPEAVRGERARTRTGCNSGHGASRCYVTALVTAPLASRHSSGRSVQPAPRVVLSGSRRAPWPRPHARGAPIYCGGGTRTSRVTFATGPGPYTRSWLRRCCGARTPTRRTR